MEKEREIQHMIATSFGVRMVGQYQYRSLWIICLALCRNSLRARRSFARYGQTPVTRKAFLEKIAAIGYGKDELEMLQKMIDAEQSDLFDVLNYVSFLSPTISRVARVEQAKGKIFEELNDKQRNFLILSCRNTRKRAWRNSMRRNCPCF